MGMHKDQVTCTKLWGGWATTLLHSAGFLLESSTCVVGTVGTYLE